MQKRVTLLFYRDMQVRGRMLKARCFLRTAMGRARAWLRLALMQKRLADYMRILLEHREDTLEEYFEPHALMLNDEAVIITGLLVGLNVVDCNLCVKVQLQCFYSFRNHIVTV